MSTARDQYVEQGNTNSDQAQHSTTNPLAGGMQMRTLIELQVIATILHQMSGINDDLASIRRSVAADIT